MRFEPGRSRLRLAAALLGAALAALAWAPAAGAAITTSSITAPAGPLFAIVDQDLPSPMLTVAGTTDSTTPLSDRLSIDCLAKDDTEDTPIHLGVEPSTTDGSFSVQFKTADLALRLCHLLAVPEGAPFDPGAFSGPITAIGVARGEELGFGVNSAAPEDFWLDDQQLEGAVEYRSLSACGLVQARLFTAALESPTATFDCSDWYAPYDEIDLAHSSRSEIRVDGVDAFAAAAIAQIAPEAQEFPALSWHYSQSSANGDLTNEESDQLSVCPGHAYPPESCPVLADSGVGEDRTVEQTDGGRLVTITDSFFSTDGRPHDLDLEPQQGARLGASSAHPVALRFPGESGFALHAPGESVAFSPSGPGIVYLRAPGAADGDPETGQGAIVFDRPSSPATFNTMEPEDTAFHFHQRVAVPATGAATVRFAYVQGFTAAEVQARAEAVATSFGWTPGSEEEASGGSAGQGSGAGSSGSSGSGGGAPGASPPSNAFELLARRLNRARGTALLTVAVPGPGTLRLAGMGVRSLRRRARHAGRVKLAVRPARHLARLLARRHHARVRLHLTFKPDGGSARTRTLRLNLREKASR